MYTESSVAAAAGETITIMREMYRKGPAMQGRACLTVVATRWLTRWPNYGARSWYVQDMFK